MTQNNISKPSDDLDDSLNEVKVIEEPSLIQIHEGMSDSEVSQALTQNMNYIFMNSLDNIAVRESVVQLFSKTSSLIQDLREVAKNNADVQIIEKEKVATLEQNLDTASGLVQQAITSYENLATAVDSQGNVLGAVASSVDTISSKIDGEGGLVQQISSVSVDVDEVSGKVSDIEAQHTIAVAAGDFVAGIQLLADSTGTSAFKVLADSFSVHRTSDKKLLLGLDSDGDLTLFGKLSIGSPALEQVRKEVADKFLWEGDVSFTGSVTSSDEVRTFTFPRMSEKESSNAKLYLDQFDLESDINIKVNGNTLASGVYAPDNVRVTVEYFVPRIYLNTDSENVVEVIKPAIHSDGGKIYAVYFDFYNEAIEPKLNQVFAYLKKNRQGGKHFLDGWSTTYSGVVIPTTIINGIATDGVSKGQAPIFKNTSWQYGDLIPVDTNKKYLCRFRARMINASGPNNAAVHRRVYAGVATYDANKEMLTGGAGTHRYCAVAGHTISTSDGWLTFEGIITGEGDSRNHFRPNTKYVRPMFIVNYDGSTTETAVDFCTFEELTADFQIVKKPFCTINQQYDLSKGGAFSTDIKSQQGEVIVHGRFPDGSPDLTQVAQITLLNGSELSLDRHSDGCMIGTEDAGKAYILVNTLKDNLNPDGSTGTNAMLIPAYKKAGTWFWQNNSSWKSIATMPEKYEVAGEIYISAPDYISYAEVWSSTKHVDQVIDNDARFVTNTNQLTDGAGLGTKATWGNVTGTGKPEDNANRTTNTSQLTDGAGLGETAKYSKIQGLQVYDFIRFGKIFPRDTSWGELNNSSSSARHDNYGAYWNLNGDRNKTRIVHQLHPLGTGISTQMECRSTDVASTSDGGINLYFPAPDEDSVVYLTYIRQADLSGNRYFGCSMQRTVNHTDGTANGNPYFWSGNVPSSNRWYLLVGVLAGKNVPSSVTNIFDVQGIYDVTNGLKVTSITARYRNRDGIGGDGCIRLYHYYDTTTSTVADTTFADPMCIPMDEFNKNGGIKPFVVAGGQHVKDAFEMSTQIDKGILALRGNDARLVIGSTQGWTNSTGMRLENNYNNPRIKIGDMNEAKEQYLKYENNEFKLGALVKYGVDDDFAVTVGSHGVYPTLLKCFEYIANTPIIPTANSVNGIQVLLQAGHIESSEWNLVNCDLANVYVTSANSDNGIRLPNKLRFTGGTFFRAHSELIFTNVDNSSDIAFTDTLFKVPYNNVAIATLKIKVQGSVTRAVYFKDCTFDTDIELIGLHAPAECVFNNCTFKGNVNISNADVVITGSNFGSSDISYNASTKNSLTMANCVGSFNVRPKVGGVCTHLNLDNCTTTGDIHFPERAGVTDSFYMLTSIRAKSIVWGPSSHTGTIGRKAQIRFAGSNYFENILIASFETDTSRTVPLFYMSLSGQVTTNMWGNLFDYRKHFPNMSVCDIGNLTVHMAYHVGIEGFSAYGSGYTSPTVKLISGRLFFDGLMKCTAPHQIREGEIMLGNAPNTLVNSFVPEGRVLTNSPRSSAAGGHRVDVVPSGRNALMDFAGFVSPNTWFSLSGIVVPMKGI